MSEPEQPFAQLEISLSSGDESSYTVGLRFERPDDPGQPTRQVGKASFPIRQLRALWLDPKAYGELLTDSLLADEDLRSFFDDLLVVTESNSWGLRVQLWVHHSARTLHSLWWETLQDPRNGDFLAMNRNRPLSRYLEGEDFSRVRLRAKGQARALVVVSNPIELAQGNQRLGAQTLVPLEVDDELQRAKNSLQGRDGRGIPRIEDLLSNPAHPGRVTLTALMRKLGEGYDVLYLACHGGFVPDRHDPNKREGPYVVLEKDDGNAHYVPVEDLVKSFRRLLEVKRPALVVLASCASAGGGRTADQEGALAALGPQLVRVGIPAVVAMQGDVLIQTVADWMPTFFEQLVGGASLDLAMAVAREGVQGQEDWWRPVLYSRLKDGQMWHSPHFVSQDPDSTIWNQLIKRINRATCTPILGPELIEFLAGSPQEMAQRWANRFQFPLSQHRLDDLPQVAQYVAGSVGWDDLCDELVDHFKAEVLEQYGESLAHGAQNRDLEALLVELGRLRRRQNPQDVYHILAELPFPIYVSANPDNLLIQALRDHAGKEPRLDFSRWKLELGKEEYAPIDADFEPSVERPLVYHLFGTVEEPDSLVLTEDDFFDYLMWVNRRNNELPGKVRLAWQTTGLLFLGFQASDWRFRVLLRSILDEQRCLKNRRRGVSVQIQPLEGHLQPQRAREYLEKKVFGEHIDIYWGSASGFLRQLWQEWQSHAGSSERSGGAG